MGLGEAQMKDTLESRGLIMGIKQIASFMGVSRHTAHRWARLGQFPAAKVGGVWMARKDGIDAWVDERIRRREREDPDG